MKITSNKKGAFGFGALVQKTRDFIDFYKYRWQFKKDLAADHGWVEIIKDDIIDFFKTHPSNLRRWLIIFRPFGFVQDQSYPFDQQFQLYFISRNFLRKHWYGEDNRTQYEWHYYKPFTLRSYHHKIIGHDVVYPEYEITSHTVKAKKLWQKEWKVIEYFENNEAHWLKAYEDMQESGRWYLV